MQSISHREFRTWVAWRQDQLNNPDRTDYYLMQIAGYVSHVMSGKRWSPKDFMIKFQTGQKPQMTPEQKTEAAKASWRTRLGLGTKKRDPYGR